MLQITAENMELFERYLIENEKSNATRKKYLHDIRRFAFLWGKMKLIKWSFFNIKRNWKNITVFPALIQCWQH